MKIVWISGGKESLPNLKIKTDLVVVLMRCTAGRL
nr:MAG TPA_asm: ANH-like nucleotide alpha hydrolase family protein [Caudoviricetes sp.]DAY82027.1 MAG TPA: ANH-like nucleotide alpha hydrolase family protein [Caudoviricetes sp.]